MQFFKNLIYFSLFASLFLSCGITFWDGDGEIAEIKIYGLQFMDKEDVLAYLGRDPKNPQEKLAPDEWRSWESQLESHPRFKSVEIQRNRALLEIRLQEYPITGVIQVENDLYEVGEDFQIISKNDLLVSWMPVLTGDFRIQNKRLEGANFYSLWKQSLIFQKDFPNLWSRLSEIESRKDGDIFMYFHYPKRMKVNMGSFLSSQQGKKLYASLAYMEAENITAEFLDLRGDDGFYY